MGSKATGIETMGSYDMKMARAQTKGFTLIASLLLLAMLSAMAIGLMMMVNTEQKVGGTDLRNDVAYRNAEGGIEKMASDLAATFQNSQAPTVGQICAVNSTPPAIPGVTWTTYSVTPQGVTCPPANPNAAPVASWNQISSGPNQGLWAQIIPINMQATAALVGGQEVSMLRSAQVALIPVFQFGVFCEGDCSFFSGPDFDMIGPVHTNGDLYPFVGPGSTLVFHSKVEAYGNVVRNQLSNGWGASSGYNGDVWIPTASTNGCSALTAAGNCTKMAGPSTSSPYGDGSVQSTGGNPPAAYIPASGTDTWTTFSASTTNHELINGNYYTPTSATLPGTGAKKLSMPFVGGNVLPYEIIRRPVLGEGTTSALATSREYNMAQIRVLLSDDPTEFLGVTSSTTPADQDPDNVRLANLTQAQLVKQVANYAPATGLNPFGITMIPGNYNPATFGAPGAGNTYNLYFAAASNAVPIPSGCAGAPPVCPTQDWPRAPQQWNDINPVQRALEGLQPAGPALGPNAPTYLNNGITPTISVCPPAIPVPAAIPAGCPNPATGAYPYYALPNANGATLNNSANSNAWSLIDGYLRVEFKDASGAWNPVTREWLGLGFARGSTAPTANGAGLPAGGTKNTINPNAILLLQEPADRSTIAAPSAAAIAPVCTAGNPCTKWSGAPPLLAADTLAQSLVGTAGDWAFGLTPIPTLATTPQSMTQYNWYPINFYDAREGEVRDNPVANPSGTTNGVMSTVEIDVGNLKRWLAGAIGISPVTGLSSGPNVDYLAQNGYVLYFSDRRGMLLNPNKTGPHPAGTKSGDAGMEDVINSTIAAGTPNQALEPAPPNAPLSPLNVALSPEDVNENAALDNWGTANMGLGFWNGANNLNTAIAPAKDPFTTRITSCSTTGRKNWVSGARHVLRLVDGSLGNLPLRPVAIVVNNSDGTTKNYWGGFTVASENPVYIWGDYNTNPTNWGADTAGQDAAAAVIADAVTLLSNNWNDNESFGIGGDGTVTNSGNNRNAIDTYYRVAIAGGKNMSFPHPAWGGAYQDFGTDGGVHNFLRFLEDWGGKNLNYKGSIVSLYYSAYGTGIYKCGNGTVYSPPSRNYSFDSDFTLPEGLPPGTPMFRDVESLGYRQVFTPRTN